MSFLIIVSEINILNSRLLTLHNFYDLHEKITPKQKNTLENGLGVDRGEVYRTYEAKNKMFSSFFYENVGDLHSTCILI